MLFSFRPITEPDARAILTWHYDGPYAVYNCDPADLEESVAAYLDPRNQYVAAHDAAGQLVGYCCFGADARVPGGDYSDADALDVGLGLRPDLTGRGSGSAFVAAILALAHKQWGAWRFRMTVAAFNQRAICAYEKAGFRVVHAFEQHNGASMTRWVQLVCERPESA